uniref:Uncharacterized protein n=1 Tax=Ciona savignyi TaxID=51511 RepID=H2ZJI3_CIOSA
MEGIPGPMPLEKLPELAQKSFTAIRSPAGEDMIFKQNAFIKQLMPAGSIRKLTEEELKVYNKPYEKEEDRMPMLTWPREIPLINDGPENMLKVAENYSNYLSKSSNLPKLFIKADPG